MQTTIFMKIEGVPSFNVRGSVKKLETTHKYEGWCEVDSLGLGVTRTAPSTGGGMTAEGGGAGGSSAEGGGECPVLDSCSVDKQPDSASTGLMKLAQSQEPFTLTLHVCTTADNQLEPYQMYVADVCRLSEYKIAMEANGSPKESLTFSFEELATGFAELSAGGKIIPDAPPKESVVKSGSRGGSA